MENNLSAVAPGTRPLRQTVATMRDSNMEALRIVAMSLILCVHMLSHAITHGSIGNRYYLWYPVLSCGVNIFFLISGWFGMRWSWRSFIRLLAVMVVFNLLNVAGCYLLGVELTAHKVIDAIIFPFAHDNGYWFMQVYLLLMFTAPVVSRGLDTMNTRTLREFIIIFSVFNFYSCWLGGNQCNITGYTYVQALYLYCLARWMRRDDILLRLLPQWVCLPGYFVITGLLGILGYYKPAVFKYELYNSLPIVLASVMMLLFFARLSFRSRAINAIASASLGCYLLQDGYIGHFFFYRVMHGWWTGMPMWRALAAYAAVFIMIWVIAYLVMSAVSRSVRRIMAR